MADFQSLIITRTRPQSESDRREIHALKIYYSQSLGASSGSSSASSSVADISEKSASEISHSSSGFHSFKAKMPQTSNFRSKPEKWKDYFPRKEKDEKRKEHFPREEKNKQGKSFLDQSKPHMLSKPRGSEVFVQGSVQQNEKDGSCFADRHHPSGKPEKPIRQVNQISSQSRQEAEKASLNSKYGKNGERAVSFSDQSGGCAPQRNTPPSRSDTGGKQDHSKVNIPPVETPRKEEDYFRPSPTLRNAAKKKEIRQNPEITQNALGRHADRNRGQDLGDRIKMNENAKRNFALDETPLRDDSAGAKHKHIKEAISQPAVTKPQDLEDRREMNKNASKNTAHKESLLRVDSVRVKGHTPEQATTQAQNVGDRSEMKENAIRNVQCEDSVEVDSAGAKPAHVKKATEQPSVAQGQDTEDHNKSELIKNAKRKIAQHETPLKVDSDKAKSKHVQTVAQHPAVNGADLEHEDKDIMNENAKRNIARDETPLRVNSECEKPKQVKRSTSQPAVTQVQDPEERKEINKNVQRNSSQNETPMKVDNAGVKPRHVKGNSPEPAVSQHSESTTPKITALYIKIHEVIMDMKDLSKVLKAKLNIEDLKLPPIDRDIKWDDQFTYCSLTCPSKNAAKKLQNLILKDRKQFHPLIVCRFNEFQKEKRHPGDPCDNAKWQQNQAAAKEGTKREVLHEIDFMSGQTLSKQKKTIDEIEQKIDACKTKLGDMYTRRETRTEIAALESKLKELQKQKTEFSTAVEYFKTKLTTLLDKDSYEQDVKLLRKQLGVECSRLERALPMYACRQDVLDLVQQNQVSVLLAETGSGKSTQIVQYLLDGGFAKHGTIVCTQPRKVAVISLTTRVAEELATTVGQKVGYKAGIKNKTSPATKILYMTDHALLNECLSDPDLKKFSCIVVDEAHERSLYTDLLLTMIKRCLQNRPDLKVIITSATIDPQVFINFFGSCPVMKVSGRAFPVDVIWEDSAKEENEFENYVDAVVSKVVEIHRKQEAGDILAFLTSATEIQKCCDMTQQRLKDRTDFKCLPLHGQLQSKEQQEVFKHLKGNVRKIVYATNCAETSITIDGIRYVVDPGVAKDMVYDAKKKVNSLTVTTVSQSSAEQRKGRAGRTAPGKCYRLYSRRSFQAMDKISLPEILKVHLGHALLKLAELGFTPDMYDFVQSPGQDSIDAALKTLHQLGALDNNAITDTGKWIVRLPFDPKLGLMTLHGHKCGLLYDSIVLASLMSTGSGLFFRGTSDKDRKKLDKAKLKFSHHGGDGLSSVQVYKTWKEMDERQRNKWCMENSINAKAIRGVKDSVDEIIQILKKEVKVEVSQQFSNAEDTPDKLRKMIFQCNVANLGHYLGKDRAGYFAAQATRQVHFHPSSSMCSLASYPEWVVYDQLLKTSRDFITGITPVDEAWLQDISTELYGFEVEEVKQKKLDVAFTQPAGSHAFFAMVGPRFKNLRHYEELCSAETSNDVVVIESSREMGELKVFATGTTDIVELLRKNLTGIVSEAVREVQQEVRELTIGSEESGLRVVLGAGGQLTDILMPHETRKIFVTNPSEDLDAETVREKFKLFGDICYIHQFPSGRNWGFVVYKTPGEAAQAEESTRSDDSNVGQLERRRAPKQRAEFKARLCWCRRPCTGIAFANISPAYMSLFLQCRTFFVDNVRANIKINKKKPDESLFLTGLPGDVTDHQIKHSLLHEMRCRVDKEGIINDVHVVRQKVGVTSKNDLKRLREDLKADFQKHLTTSSVEISVRPPGEHDTRFAAEAFFTDPIEGFHACELLKGRLRENGFMVDIVPIVSATLHVHRLVYEACKEELDELKAEELTDVEMDIKNQNSENWLLCLKADEMESLVQARTFINEVIKGDVLDCNAAPDLKHLMTSAGMKMIKEAESKTSAYVCVDRRTQTLAIHGSAKACTQMRMRINDYLEKVLSGTVEELTLNGSGRPPGLLKALANKYDESLDTLREEVGLLDITINYRWHKVKFTGPPESIAKAKQAVEELSTALTEACQQRMDEGEESIDCVACFCPIESNELYRLEACAHPYCKDCIKRQVSIAIKDHHLPVACCQEGCDLLLSWRDFNSLSRQGHLKLQDLASSALSAYVLANRDKASFCTTPNCPMVYRLTSEEDAKTFLCPECSVRVCTGCGAQAHEGMSCRMLRSSSRARSGVDDWVSRDKKNRKACPGCYSPIEKTGGCNKMMCDACKTIFCWLCKKKFPTCDACYKHLTEEHGGVFEERDLLY